MKRLVTTVTIFLVLVALAAAGCTNKGLIPPSPEADQEVTSTCVTCHTDKDTLKELATTEEAVNSEATTGEG